MSHQSTKKSFNDDKRRLRNRLSQQAFRRRQAAYLKELREKADSNNRPPCETIEALRVENSQLRQQLLDVQAKIARLVTTMTEISGSVSSVLDEASQCQVKNHHNDAKSTPGTEESSGVSAWGGFDDDLTTWDISSQNITQSSRMDENPQHPQQPSVRDDCIRTTDNLPLEETGSVVPIESSQNDAGGLTWQIPNIWTFDYQMGPQAYDNALSRSQESALVRGKLWSETNSPFSDHIDVLQQLLKARLELFKPRTEQSPHLFYTRVLMVLSLFNSMTRPDVMAWYAKTRFYHIVDLTAWKVHPCTQTLSKVFQPYRPTKLQLISPHPDVIDWIPFPSIRDRLIQFHASNPKIDQIFCDTVSSYVVEAWMSDLVANAPKTRAYIRVNDLVDKIPSTVKWSEVETRNVLPAQDSETLFLSPECSQAVFKALNMNRGAAYYKIDPSFFGKYPELYDHDVDISAQGIPLRPLLQTNLSSPKRLDSQTFEIYRHFIDFSIDAPVGMS